MWEAECWYRVWTMCYMVSGSGDSREPGRLYTESENATLLERSPQLITHGNFHDAI